MNNHLKVLFAASEVAPFAKTGGLADVVFELSKALKELNCDVRIVLPLYEVISKEKFNIKPLNKKITIKLGNSEEEISLFYTTFHDIPIYFIHHKDFFESRQNLYGTQDGDYIDNDKRFILFSRSILEMLQNIDFIPDIIHANDWQTGLIPLYIKYFYQYKIKSVFTIHNLAYQGIFPKTTLKSAGLGEEYFNVNSLEFYEKISFIKSGIIYSDYLTTVSPHYAEEIKNPEFGFCLDGLIKPKHNFIGIINGIDYSIWNPKTSKNIKSNYDIKNLSGKKKCKLELQNIQNLPVLKNTPIISIISRLADQKGFDIILEVFEKIMGLDLQLILLGVGEKKYHTAFEKYKNIYSEKLSINLNFKPELAEKIYSGSDMFLMPSHFEPCGLGQLISMRFGTIPIVRRTGGLYDSVIPYTYNSKLKPTGFAFNNYTGKELLHSIKIALEVYKNKKEWKTLTHNAMGMDFSWQKSADDYLKLYNKIINI